MRAKKVLIGAVLAGAIVAPAAARADHVNNNCAYTSGDQFVQTVQPGVVIYLDTDGKGGTSGRADQSAGVCLQQAGMPGGNFEAGHSATLGSNDSLWYSLARDGFYVVADGNRNNPDPADGYAGVSNFESGTQSACDNNQDIPNNGRPVCNGSNGGGEVGAPGGPYAPVYVPVVCGNTTGDQWDNSKRDGCEVA